jgi:predicted TIM-barrel fold metal-dependent hydrolase
VIKRTKNIIIDTKGILGEWITKIVQEIGPERVAMGSDYPYNHLEATLKIIEVAVPDPKAREWVMDKTAARLLRIKSE